MLVFLTKAVQEDSASVYLAEWMRLDLWELVLHVVRVHGTDLVSRWSTQDFDDLDQLVNARLAREQRLTKHELGHDAACGPHIWKQ
jgi:hypothetical protein